ncbi:hypothetical protein [Streptomyces sp. NPDC127112]|uniref:hypothetical protein n=1 Tax=Streptomyces sp. NPDC127112 TaxID=3345364 RepID=UPI00363518F0
MSEHWDPAGFKGRIDALLEDFLAAEAERLVTIDGALRPVTEQLRVAARHGKRMRAAFCYWGWRASGQPGCDALLRAAASMELVHAAATVPDDSPIRHGLPTVHVALETPLASGSRPCAGGRSLAMLVGDPLMSLAGPPGWGRWDPPPRRSCGSTPAGRTRPLGWEHRRSWGSRGPCSGSGSTSRAGAEDWWRPCKTGRSC